MTREAAHTTANLLLGAACAAAGYYVLTTPSLRRMGWRLARVALTTTVPAYFVREVGRAWAASGHGS